MSTMDSDEQPLESAATILVGSDDTLDEKSGANVYRRHTTSATSLMEEGSSSHLHDHEFIDYIPPPKCPCPPPAKYKLWLVIMVLVYFASWFSNAAGIVSAFSRSGYLNVHAALFIMLGIIVFVLVYAALDLMVHCLTFTIKDHVYGLDAWLKAPRLAPKLQSYDNILAEIAAAVIFILEDGFQIFNPPVQRPLAKKPQEYDCADDFDGQVVLKIQHQLKPDYWDEYYAWQKKITKLANSQPGLIEAKACEPEGDRQTIIVKFTSVDRLNEYMTSPARRKLMRKLEPLLLAPDTLQLQKDRDLPDAFTDLLTRQGECVPTLLPKKWKVWWLTTCGLFFVILISEVVLPYYYAIWGLDTSHDRLRALVEVLFTTFFNSFVMTPFLIMLFSDWVQRKPEGENDTKEPWRTLNDGLSNIWLKVLVSVAFYGGCVIAWAVKSN